MPQKTHYETLGVARNATTLELQAAYTRIVIIEGPIKTRVPGPFARAQAEKHVKAAGEAWDVLRNEHLRQQYDKTLPPMDADSSASRLRTPFTDKRDEHFSTDPEGTFCYGVDSHGTEIPIIIDNWRFTVNISRKFSFTGHLEERRKPADDYDTVSFDIGLSRAHYSHEAKNPTMNEFTIKLDHIPEGLRLLSLRTLFKETANKDKILNITLSAGKCILYRPSLPMEFGFDFDMNDVVANAQKCGTCMVFTFLEPPDWLKASKDSLSGPDYPLRREPDLKVQEFVDMGAVRCVKIRYGDVEMWRLASVGYKPDPNWRKGWYNVK